MREYKTKIDEIKNLFNRYEESKDKAFELPAEEYDVVLNLLDESKKLRAKATKKLNKLAEDLGFRILKDIKIDDKFTDVVYSIESRIDDALEALNNISRFNHNIEHL